MKGSAADVVRRANAANALRNEKPPRAPASRETAGFAPAQAGYLPVRENGPMFRDPPPLAPPSRNPGVYRDLMKKHDRMTPRHG